MAVCEQSHTEKAHPLFIMAMIDFHLAQCHFAGAITIAALAFTVQESLLISWIASPELFASLHSSYNSSAPAGLIEQVIPSKSGFPKL